MMPGSFASLAAMPLHAGEVMVQTTTFDPVKVDCLLPVLAPNARALAVSETLGWVAVGHKFDHTHQVTLYKLDAQGKGAAKRKPSSAPAAARTKTPGNALWGSGSMVGNAQAAPPRRLAAPTLKPP